MALRFLNYEVITVSTTAIGFTAARLTNNIVMAKCKVIAQPLMVRADGTNPTSDAGYPYAANEEFEVWGEPNLSKFRAIRQGGTDANLHVAYYGVPA